MESSMAGNNMATLLPISTRGVGMGVSQLYWMLSTCDYFFEAVPHICSMYRALLGHVEIKLANVQRRYSRYLSEADKELQYKAEFPHDFGTVEICPRSMADVVNAVGYLRHPTGNYVPAVHKRVYEDDRYVPRTDNILFSNLRETVVALSDPNTPLMYRKNFFKNNPIPGAQVENHLLLNPDEIIPPGFGMSEEHVGSDMNRIFDLVCEMEMHFGNVQIRLTKETVLGKECLLITNTQGNLAIPTRRTGQNLSDYYMDCRPIGNITDFWSPGIFQYSSTVDDPATLWGELPNLKEFKTPLYDVRDGSRCEDSIFLYTGYQEICNTIYPPYSEPPMPINLIAHSDVTRELETFKNVSNDPGSSNN